MASSLTLPFKLPAYCTQVRANNKFGCPGMFRQTIAQRLVRFSALDSVKHIALPLFRFN